MIRRFLLVATVVLLPHLPSSARAETVRVLTGDHADFTRLVLDLAQPTDARVNRTDDGYELLLLRSDVRFDLSQIYRSITRSRLGTVWVDPRSGALQLGVDCACHARVERLSGDVLVLDLVDGRAQPGSLFETRSDGSAAPPLQSAREMRPRPRPVLASTLPNLLVLGLPQPALPAIADRATLPLRNDLLDGFARAAAAGLVDPAEKLDPPGEAHGFSPRIGTQLGDLPQVSVASPNDKAAPVTAEGAECIEDGKLAIETWADGQPFAVAAAAHDAALLGEFDHVKPEGLSAAVRFYLYSGFGAESAALLDAFPNSLPDADLWREMAMLLDGTTVAERSGFPLLEGQAACSGKAALWAALSADHPGKLPGLDRAALRQAFSAMPSHLRQSLGPRLAERLMNDGDMATARAVIDATDRAPGPASPAARLATANLATREGDAPQGERIASSVLPDAGPDRVNALIARANAQLAQKQAVDPALLGDLASIVAEVGDGPEGNELARTRALATASTGDYGQAFALAAPLAPSVHVDLWTMLANGGPDSAIVTYALDQKTAPVTLPLETRLRLSERLLALGFLAEAMRWTPGGDPAGRLVAARAELLAGGARAALTLIAGDESKAADEIRAAAMMQLGEFDPATAAYERLGDEKGAATALWQSQNWSGWLEKADAPGKKDVARLLAPVPGFDAAASAPLAQGRELVADAEAAAQDISAVLALAPSP